MPEKFETKTTRRITPEAFAAWLHAQGEEPSAHIKHWFEARGVSWPLASADASPFPLADWPALVRYRLSFKNEDKRAPDWGLGNQLQIARDELARRIASGEGKTVAGDAMGRALEYKGGAPHKQLFKALDTQRSNKRGYALGGASPLPSTQVRSGHKTA